MCSIILALRVTPPSHTSAISREKLMGKVANFLNFLKYENGRMGTTFFSQNTYSVVGRGPMWSSWTQFYKGGPCQEKKEGKITDQNR